MPRGARDVSRRPALSESAATVYTPAQLFVSMAVTIMGGLAFATLLTLLMVPTLYAVMFRIPSPPARAGSTRLASVSIAEERG